MKVFLALFINLTIAIKLLHGSTNDLSRTYRIVAFGDFGDQDQSLQIQVRDAIAREHSKSAFWRGVFLGDNFYPGGVSGIEDLQFSSKIIDIYSLLDIPFNVILGNHDHQGNILGQVDFTYAKHLNPIVKEGTSQEQRLWNMRAPVYSQAWQHDEAPDLEIFALDTEMANPYIQTKDSVQWVEQLAWLEKKLKNSPARWKIVLGHHPVNSDYRRIELGGHTRYANMNKLARIIESHAHIYLSGHDHSLQILPVNGEYSGLSTRGCLQVISGSGGTHDTINRYSGDKSIVRSHPGQIGFVSLNISNEHIEVQTFVGEKGDSFSKLKSVWVYPNQTFSSDAINTHEPTSFMLHEENALDEII